MNNHIPDEAIQILLVEDNPGDVRLTQEAFKESNTKHRLHVARDGIEALAFVNRAVGYQHAPEPDLILLDLNLPRKNGREVLAEIKSNSAFRHIPVIILSTSQADQDIEQTYALLANSYITKPLDLDDFIDIIQTIESYWLSTVKLPPKNKIT